MIKKGNDIYNKKRIFSIYCNITPILSGNCFTPKVASFLGIFIVNQVGGSDWLTSSHTTEHTVPHSAVR